MKIKKDTKLGKKLGLQKEIFKFRRDCFVILFRKNKNLKRYLKGYFYEKNKIIYYIFQT